MQTQGIELSAASLGYAGAYAAREAVGYYKLKRFDFYANTRAAAIRALTTAVSQLQSFGTPAEVAKFSAILSLVQSDRFVQVAPSSDILTAL